MESVDFVGSRLVCMWRHAPFLRNFSEESDCVYGFLTVIKLSSGPHLRTHPKTPSIITSASIAFSNYLFITSASIAISSVFLIDVLTPSRG